MSWCRWSTDNFKCDLYCYESVDGIVTHIADRRFPPGIPEVPHLLSVDGDTWMEARRVQGIWMDEQEMVEITLPHAGETFVDENLLDFASRLAYLKELGYVFPEELIDNILKEEENDRLVQNT